MHWRRKWQPTPVFLPGKTQGRGRPVGCHLWGRTESDATEATEQQTVARQAPLSMEFSRQEYWRGLPCPPPADLPDLGIELMAPAARALQAGSLLLSHQRSQDMCILKLIHFAMFTMWLKQHCKATTLQ